MPVPLRTTIILIALALLSAACGGTGGVTVDPLDESSDDDVLSSCEAAGGGGDTSMLVEASEERPPVDVMEDAVAENPDAEFGAEELEAEGRSREQALHAMYAQTVGERLFADVTELPGYVTGAYAQPLEGVPFQLSFSGEVPEELDPDAYDLASFGLEVTTGASGLDQEAMAAAVETVEEVGMDLVSASGDEVTGTARIEVLDATPEQIADWEEAVDDPSLWCLVRATRSVPCDDSVIAEAEEQAEGQGEVLPNQQGDEPPTKERAEEVHRTYLGLTWEVAQEKATEEGRTVRVVVQDGVPLGANDDLDPGRLSVTLCNGVVVDTWMDLEPEG